MGDRMTPPQEQIQKRAIHDDGCECGSCRRRRRRASLYSTPCSYEAAHWRVRTARGKASQWHCARCGAQASQWAYVGDSPREIRGIREYTRGGRRRRVVLSWSPDPADYLPSCRDCNGKEANPRYGAGRDREHARAYAKAYRAAIAADPVQLARDREEHRARARKQYEAIKADPERYAQYLAYHRERRQPFKGNR